MNGLAVMIEEGGEAYEWSVRSELWLPLGKTKSEVRGAAYGSDNRLYKITSEFEIFR